MTSFSVIVPCHNVRAYLAECLDSVLTQLGPEDELIAVDSASTDGTGQMLEAYDHAQMVLVQLTEAGLGHARNMGLDQAHGDYVVFLDSDDVLEPGSLEAIRARVEATGQPDVLMYDHARLYWNGSLVRNTRSDLLAEAEQRGVFTIAEFPELLLNFNVAWNKAYRRAFIEAEGMRFPPGIYEDIPWTMNILCKARTIAGLDRVVVQYRQRVAGSILKTGGRQHFDALDQWQRAWRGLDAVDLAPDVRAAVFEYMVRQLVVIIRQGNRVPASARPDFFAGMSRLFNEYVPEGREAYPLRQEEALDRFIAGNNYERFILHGRMRRAPKRARAVGRRIRNTSRGILEAGGRRPAGVQKELSRRIRYKSERRTSLNPRLAVFSAYWHRTVACNPAAIAAELEARQDGWEIVWAIDPTKGGWVPEGAATIDPRTPDYWSALAAATYLVNNVNFEMGYVKRPGQVVVQTQHGTPLKSMGLDMRAYPEARAGFKSYGLLLRRIATWDYLISSNRYSSLIWERGMPGHYETLETGYPRNDVLARGDAGARARVLSDLGLPETARPILYCPTIRDYQEEFSPLIDLAMAQDRLADDQFLLVRGHYLHEGIERSLPGRRVVNVASYPSIEDLCLASDLLVTDYSSVMFDYANTGKPIINYAPDWDLYRRIRGTYFDLSVENAGNFVTDEEALWDQVAAGQYAGSDTAAYRSFAERFTPWDDGSAAARVVDSVFYR